jgi:hypothetical protein
MTTIESKLQTDAQGTLSVSIPLGIENANRQVRVLVQPIESTMTDDQWCRFVLSTSGSITDPTFRRHAQGEFEQREELFP